MSEKAMAERLEKLEVRMESATANIARPTDWGAPLAQSRQGLWRSNAPGNQSPPLSVRHAMAQAAAALTEIDRSATSVASSSGWSLPQTQGVRCSGPPPPRGTITAPFTPLSGHRAARPALGTPSNFQGPPSPFPDFSGVRTIASEPPAMRHTVPVPPSVRTRFDSAPLTQKVSGPDQA